jgi:tetratricopeptide (TPR) repeat protein
VIQGFYNVRITIYRGTSHCSFNGIITEIQQYVLIVQGHCAEAEASYRRIMEPSKRTFGEDHPETLWNIYGLADALRGQKKYSEAEALYRQLVEARGRILGKEHKDTLNSAYWLANTLRCQKKYGEAEIIYRQTFEIWERTLRAGSH